MSEDTTLQVQDIEKEEVPELGAERTRDRLAFVPRVDIYETENAITIVADIPGADQDSLDITLEDDVLTLNGYVEMEQPEGQTLAYAEYRVGDYQRAFTIPNQIDRENIEAVLRDGVLRLTLPKQLEARKRNIAIKPG